MLHRQMGTLIIFFVSFRKGLRWRQTFILYAVVAVPVHILAVIVHVAVVVVIFVVIVAAKTVVVVVVNFFFFEIYTLHILTVCTFLSLYRNIQICSYVFDLFVFWLVCIYEQTNKRINSVRFPRIKQYHVCVCDL